MNDVQFVEASRNLASRLLSEHDDRAARVRAAYEICLSRLPDAKEAKVITALFDSSLKSFRDDPNLVTEFLSYGESSVASHVDQAELAAWTIVCNAILNLDETLNQH